MKITWLGHGGFRIEIGGEVLLIDPWLDGNPVFPADRRAEALSGATHILLTHGHFDHTNGLADVVAETGAPVWTMVELAQALGGAGVEATGFNMGGTVALGEVTATMVPASHSASFGTDKGPVYAGTPAGFVIRGEGRTLYVSGDTGIMADMSWIGQYFKPDIGILCAGGFYTMDMDQAAWAAKTYFDFKTVIPCHYRTFPALEQSADALKAGLPGVAVLTPEVMETIEV